MKTYFEKIIDSNNLLIRWAFILFVLFFCVMPIYKIGKADGKKINFNISK